jgi:hypothetical protein
VIATFIALYAFGFTLNFLTLMALSLCIGLLIDDAIVVRENIVRHLGMGKTTGAAARGHRRDRPRGDGDDVRDRRRVRADRFMSGLIGASSSSSASPSPWRCSSRCSCRSRSIRCCRRSGTIRRLALQARPWLGRFMDRSSA